MGIWTLDGILDGTKEAACLVDGTTGTAFGPVFENSADADAFLRLASKEGAGDVRTLDRGDLSGLHARLLAMPLCENCGERVVEHRDDAPPNECAGCFPECDENGCSYRGDVTVEHEGNHVGVFCAPHAKIAEHVIRSHVAKTEGCE